MLWMRWRENAQAATFVGLLGVVGGLFGDADAVLELGVVEDVGDELVAVEAPPALLGGIEQLVGIASAAFLDPAPEVSSFGVSWPEGAVVSVGARSAEGVGLRG